MTLTLTDSTTLRNVIFYYVHLTVITSYHLPPCNKLCYSFLLSFLATTYIRIILSLANRRSLMPLSSGYSAQKDATDLQRLAAAMG